MQKVTITIKENRNAYVLLKLIKEFDFVDSIDFELEVDEDEKELFTNELNPDDYLDDFGLTVNELREQIIRDKKEEGMTKEEFFKSMKEWREEIELI